MKTPRYEIRKAKNKQFYFVLIAADNKVIATGETYKTKLGAAKATRRIKEIFEEYGNLVLVDKTK